MVTPNFIIRKNMYVKNENFEITCINVVFVEWDDEKYRINFDCEHVQSVVILFNTSWKNSITMNTNEYISNV